MSSLISIDITTNIEVADVLKACRHQHGLPATIEAIISYCCENNDFEFEDALIAALQKFKEDNA